MAVSTIQTQFFLFVPFRPELLRTGQENFSGFFKKLSFFLLTFPPLHGMIHLALIDTPIRA